MDKAKKDESIIIIRKAKAVRIVYWVFQILTFATLLASLIIYLIKKDGRETTFNQIFMCVITLLTLNIPLLLERKFKIFIPNYISIVLYFMLFFHFVLGEVYRAYDNIVLFDKILHTTSGVIIAFVSFSIVSILNNMQKTHIKLSPFFIVLFTFCFTMTSEYLWEIFEYLMDSVFNSNMQRWQDGLILAEGAELPRATASGMYVLSNPRGSGLLDTMGDMMVNIFGALAVCIYAYVGMKLKPNWFTSRTILTKSDIISLQADKNIKIDKSYYEAVGSHEKKRETADKVSAESAAMLATIPNEEELILQGTELPDTSECMPAENACRENNEKRENALDGKPYAAEYEKENSVSFKSSNLITENKSIGAEIKQDSAEKKKKDEAAIPSVELEPRDV